MDNNETTEVLIVGCGPTGAMLSTLLGQYGVKNIVLEREPDITTDPRGIALDEDGIRCLQACGIYDKVFTDIGQCMGSMKFISGQPTDLYKKEFLSLSYGTTEGGTGHPGFLFHKQPSIERHLRSRIAALPSSELRVSSTVTGIREDEEWVYTDYTDPNGQVHSIRSQFLVGCDGKTGFTRKKYLEPRGISLEKAHQTTYEETWVALNWKISLPTPTTHPNFPLWKKGYTPQQVYDLFFPTDFRFLCHPVRPSVCGRFGMNEDRLWRFEFLVLRGEDGHEMSGEEKIREIVWPYLTHPARHFGLKGDPVTFPADCVEVLRCRPFNFAARSCNKWALGRVVLCGDAAHVFPPFGGQGIASGFRDAIALAWRLRLATRTAISTPPNNGASETQGGSDVRSPDFNKLFLGWYAERKQSLDRSLASTIENGNYVTESHPLKAFVRDWSLWLMQLVPSWKHWLELGNRRDGMVVYKWEAGKEMCFLPEMGGGGNLPQVYCTRVGEAGVSGRTGGAGEEGSGQRMFFTDDVIFAEGKMGLFQLVVLLGSLAEVEAARSELAEVQSEVEREFVKLDEATFILQQTVSPTAEQQDANVYRLATAEEFVEDQVLCIGRPPPTFYDPFRMTKEVKGRRFVLLRPDRFVFAATSDGEELRDAVRHLAWLCH